MTEANDLRESAKAPAGENLQITKERVKDWCACNAGYRWFLEKFPQGGEFSEVYGALNADRRYDDAGWLLDRVFGELDTGERVRQTVRISGADRIQIEAMAAAGGGANAATTGNWANAATTGYRANAATTGEGAIAASLGIGARAKAGAGGAIVLAGRDNISGRLLHVFAAKVGENGIKADTWYELDANGDPIEVDL